MKKILIVGANFANKGAQSMLFTTIDKIKKKFCDSEIYFATNKLNDFSKYKFNAIFYTKNSKKIALEDNNRIIILKCRIKCYIKNCIKLIFRKKTFKFEEYTNLNNIIKFIDIIIDVSGFNLGKKWTIESQESYLDNIRLAKKYNIPIILMPQSFGPFDYEENEKFLLEEIKELLKYPKIIYAREKDGYNELVNKFGLSNVKLSTDLVLQNSEIDLNNIYITKPILNIPKIKKNSVAIVPNMQCFNHGNKEDILKLYKDIVNKLLEMNKNIYLLRHSFEDIYTCELIKNMFIDNDNVILLNDDLSCLEYDALIKKFDFIICSRFHGVVHAYKNIIPAIVLGWAIKYQELTQNLEQKEYCFNIIENDIDINKILNQIEKMNSNLNEEKNKIQKKLMKIQEYNCFEFLDNL